jgi:hypothetical protein
MSKLLGGKLAMKERLVKAISEGLTAQRLSAAELDKICGFGANARSSEHQVPTTAEFQENPRLMTSGLFSAASFALDLNIDEVLSPNLSSEQTKQVIEQMRCESGCVVASCGNPGCQPEVPCESQVPMTAAEVPCESQVPVYVIMKALQEMDEAGTTDDE